MRSSRVAVSSVYYILIVEARTGRVIYTPLVVLKDISIRIAGEVSVSRARYIDIIRAGYISVRAE